MEVGQVLSLSLSLVWAGHNEEMFVFHKLLKMIMQMKLKLLRIGPNFIWAPVTAFCKLFKLTILQECPHHLP